MEFYGIQVEFHGMPWNSMECHRRYIISMAFQWNSVASRWNAMECHGMPWTLHYFHGISVKSLGTKSIFLAGLEIEISQKLDLVTGHGGHFEKRIFFIVWTLLERVTRSNIFPHIKIYPICLIWRRKIIFFKWPKD